MNLLLLYPPKAYAQMPPLAPYLLKGFLETASHHKADTVDLNLRYHNYCWGGRMLEEHFALKGQLPPNAQRYWQELRSYGPEIISYFRNSRNHTAANLKNHKKYYSLLQTSTELADLLTRTRCGRTFFLPDAYDGWDGYTDGIENSVEGRFILNELDAIDLAKYSVVGISATYLEQVAFSYYIAKLIKTKFPSIRTIIGGSGFSHLLKDFSRDKSFWRYFDFGIPYEGEAALLDTVTCIENGSSETPPNVIRLGHAGIEFNCEPKAKQRRWTKADFSQVEDLFPTPGIVFPVLTSRGCYWQKCSFCTHHESYDLGYSPSPVDMLTDNLRHIASLGGRRFYFVDEALSYASVNNIVSCLSGLKPQLGGADVAWMAEIRAEKKMLDPGFVRALQGSGCRLLVNGIESGSANVLRRMRKGIELDDAVEFARLCRNSSIKVGWMFFIGFPTETIEEARETFEFIKKNKNLISYATVGTFGLECGSEVWRNPEKFDIREIMQKDDPYKVVFDYVRRDGKKYGKRELKEGLGVFMNYYFPELESVFADVVDRSFALFSA
jgi:radical SAM superfamily enzyme YgiQ (UPF0313 family)